MKARILEKTLLYEGFLKLYRYRFEIEQHGGGSRVVHWEMMERGRSVGVLGHDPKRDEIHAARCFRCWRAASCSSRRSRDVRAEGAPAAALA